MPNTNIKDFNASKESATRQLTNLLFQEMSRPEEPEVTFHLKLKDKTVKLDIWEVQSRGDNVIRVYLT